VRVPERDAEFWEALPRRVVAAAQTGSRPQSRPESPRWALFTIFGAKFALAGLVLGFCLWQSHMPQAMSHRLLKEQREMRQALARIPQSLDMLMRDEHGLHSLIQDQP
jgi:hypothetical protein